MKNIRHEIKKKRIFFDENKERFGLDNISQLVKVKNTSEVKGYPFKASKSAYNKITAGIRFGLKVVPIETKYDKSEHPCNLENLVLKLLCQYQERSEWRRVQSLFRQIMRDTHRSLEKLWRYSLNLARMLSRSP